MVKGVLFDMDGVLVDSEVMYIQTDGQAAAEQGFDFTPEMFLETTGSNAAQTRAQIVAMLGDTLDYDKFRARSNELADEYIAAGKLPPMKGLVALLPWLKARGIKRAVATSNHLADAKAMLSAVGVYDYFDAFMTGEMVGPSKPEPDIFIEAARALDLAPQDCIAVEDSFNGIHSAHAAGCITVMVPDQRQPSDEIRALCDAVLDSLEDLPAYIEKINAN